MLTNQMASHRPAGQTATTAGALPDSGAGMVRLASRRRVNGGKSWVWLLVALVPLSAVLAFVVLQVMASASAAATGGCGGG